MGLEYKNVNKKSHTLSPLTKNGKSKQLKNKCNGVK